MRLCFLVIMFSLLGWGPACVSVVKASAIEAVRQNLIYAALVTDVRQDGTITLDSGQKVKLRNLVTLVPDQADEIMRQLLVGVPVSVRIGAGEADRYGRWPVDVETSKGRDMRQVLLARGLALAWPRPLSEADEQAERNARAQRLGVWARPSDIIRCALSKDYWPAEFMIVRGKVHAVGRNQGRTYLNFEEDWRSDFTVRMPTRDEETFLGAQAENLIGADIEVRGWVHWSGGPMVDLELPGQVQKRLPSASANERSENVEAPVCKGFEG